MAVWTSRTGAGLEKGISGFLCSIGQDAALVRHDIIGSIAHARMLGQCGIVPMDTSVRLVAGLKAVWSGFASGRSRLLEDHEDVHMNIEHLLEEEIGHDARHLHTGRSRNDQVALDLRLLLRGAVCDVIEGLLGLRARLVSMASEHAWTVVAGHTHMQQAQPIVLGHLLLAHDERFTRDTDRLADAFARMDRSPLGAGALAGTSLPIDPGITADLLGFCDVFDNSMDAVSDRDFAVETVFDLSLTMVHISQLCEEAVLWCSKEFGWMTPGSGTCTGSSMMPQKVNPDVFELARGRAGRVAGDLMALLCMLKGLPMTYNRDLQEDKPAVLDAVATTSACIEAVTRALAASHLHPPAPKDGGILATDMAEGLVAKGRPFRDAYDDIAALMKHPDGRTVPPDVDASVRKRASHGGTAPGNVERSAAKADERIARDLGRLAGMSKGCMRASQLLEGPTDPPP